MYPLAFLNPVGSDTLSAGMIEARSAVQVGGLVVTGLIYGVGYGGSRERLEGIKVS